MSGRIRSLKPEWLEDEKLLFASSDARVLSVALILLADDYGNGRAHPKFLAPRTLPNATPEEFESALGELTGWYVSFYEIDGQRYFSLKNWKRHQRVDKPGPARVPSPPDQFANDSRTAREPLAKLREPLAPDLDLDQDHDQDQERTTTTARAVERSDRFIPCPADIRLTDAQRTNAVMAGVPESGIDAVTAEYIGGYLAKPGEKRTGEQWLSGLSRAVLRDGREAARRIKESASPTEKLLAEARAGEHGPAARVWADGGLGLDELVQVLERKCKPTRIPDVFDPRRRRRRDTGVRDNASATPRPAEFAGIALRASETG